MKGKQRSEQRDKAELLSALAPTTQHKSVCRLAFVEVSVGYNNTKFLLHLAFAIKYGLQNHPSSTANDHRHNYHIRRCRRAFFPIINTTAAAFDIIIDSIL